MHSSSPGKFQELQLTVEQPSTGECWIPLYIYMCVCVCVCLCVCVCVFIYIYTYTACPREKEKPKKDGRRGKITFRIKPHTCPRCSEGSNKTLCTPGPRKPTETRKNCVWVSPAEVQVSSGLLHGQKLWVQYTWVWHKTSCRRSPLTPPYSIWNLNRAGETDSWRAQTKPWDILVRLQYNLIPPLASPERFSYGYLRCCFPGLKS